MDPRTFRLPARTARRRTVVRGLMVLLGLALATAACGSGGEATASPSGSATGSPEASTTVPTSSPTALPTTAPTSTPSPTPAATATPTPKPSATVKKTAAPTIKATPHPTAPTKTTDVTGWDVQSSWVGTALSPKAGDVLVFNATGLYRGGTGQPNVNPITINCGIEPHNYPGFPAPHLERFSVIGRIGAGGEPFCIGGGRAIQVTTSGTLQVTINTNDHAGALGSVQVTTILYHWPAPAPMTTVDLSGWDVQSSWVGTTIDVAPGDMLIFFAIGRYRGTMGGTNGTPASFGCVAGKYTNNVGFPAPKLTKYAVIGRFGSGVPFCIAAGRTMTVTATGNLDVTVNTDDHAGALGWVEVSTVQYRWP
jgi:hypothetical protein